MADRNVCSLSTVIEFHYREPLACVTRKLGSSMLGADIVHDASMCVRRPPYPRTSLFFTGNDVSPFEWLSVEGSLKVRD